MGAVLFAGLVSLDWGENRRGTFRDCMVINLKPRAKTAEAMPSSQPPQMLLSNRRSTASSALPSPVEQRPDCLF